MRTAAAILSMLFLQDEAPKPLWTATEGLEGPESAYYDAESGLLFVSNVAGAPAEKDGKVDLFATGEELEYPNGLLVHDDKLIVAPWGKPEADFSTKVPGRLFSLDLGSKEKALITKEPLGNLDGLELDGSGGYIVTDWMAGKVIHVPVGGKPRTILTLPKGAADHAVLTARNLLIVPRMLDNQVAAFDLSKLLD